MINKFQKGSGCFICEHCSKRTRRTIEDNTNETYCDKCVEMMMHENSIMDNKDLWDKETMDLAQKQYKKMVDNYLKRKGLVRNCKLCNKPISEEEWDNFSGMCAKCENDIYDCSQADKEEE